MAKVKKIRKAQDGTLCNWSDKKGGGVSCGKPGGVSTQEYKPGKSIRWTKKESEEADKQTRFYNIKRGMLKAASEKYSTAPGLRKNEISGESKKGTQSFFGGDRAVSEARRGKKVVKKAKMGKKVVNKSKKK